MSQKVAEEALQQHWVHSHEEDTPTETVYRPATFSFPPSRGRQSFELKPDGTLVRYSIGPTDRREASTGRWELKDGNRLVLHPDTPSEPDRAMQIASVDSNRLVIRK